MDTPSLIKYATFDKSVDFEVNPDGIIYIVFHEVFQDETKNTQQAEQFQEMLLTIFAKTPQLIYEVGIDASNVSNIEFISTEARAIYMRCMNHPQIAYVFFSGMGFFLKTMTSFFAQLTGRWKRTKWFATFDEGKQWMEQIHTEQKIIRAQKASNNLPTV